MKLQDKMGMESLGLTLGICTVATDGIIQLGVNPFHSHESISNIVQAVAAIQSSSFLTPVN